MVIQSGNSDKEDGLLFFKPGLDESFSGCSEE